eukprot:Cvel_25711.t1-p1 / transcript=Cvel_25711.t1 / gene=Cvel_25711 / organism=Chromera_velia_CCMP2878 / gene_product=DNA repair protein rad5, putative / transcript_product=DNA repair protein rad5, putative / location=Cvel_scaffold2952:1-18780(-) / protein_length=2104 / sequence_SO=supercontig / SO=protein_coding / is_pseudo=false
MQIGFSRHAVSHGTSVRDKKVLQFLSMYKPAFWAPPTVPKGAQSFRLDAGAFYGALRDFQRQKRQEQWRRGGDITPDVHHPPDLEVPGLTAKLWPHQLAAVEWMRRRERSGARVSCPDPLWLPLRSPFAEEEEEDMTGGGVSSEVLWVNAIDGSLCTSPPSPLEFSIFGGVLADEMGLGKSLEVLALVLMDKPPVLKKKLNAGAIPRLSLGPPDEEEEEDVVMDVEIRVTLNPLPRSSAGSSVCEIVDVDGEKKEREGGSEGSDWIADCVCGANGEDEYEGEWVACEECNMWMHSLCVRGGVEGALKEEDKFICPPCTYKSGNLQETGATLIVAPTSIVGQWLREVRRHAEFGCLKVLFYRGVRQAQKRLAEASDHAQWLRVERKRLAKRVLEEDEDEEEEGERDEEYEDEEEEHWKALKRTQKGKQAQKGKKGKGGNGKKGKEKDNSSNSRKASGGRGRGGGGGRTGAARTAATAPSSAVPSEEASLCSSLGLTQRRNGPEHGMAVQCTEVSTGNVRLFASVRKAAEALGMNAGTVSRALQRKVGAGGKTNQTGGFKFTHVTLDSSKQQQQREAAAASVSHEEEEGEKENGDEERPCVSQEGEKENEEDEETEAQQLSALFEKNVVSRDQLMGYDLVITSFDVLKDEIYHADLSDRSFRFKKLRRILPSPLTSVLWRRLVIDEAQLVEGYSKAAQMCTRLQARYRWCVSGTPITRGLSQDLPGLLSALAGTPPPPGQQLQPQPQGPGGQSQNGDGDGPPRPLDVSEGLHLPSVKKFLELLAFPLPSSLADPEACWALQCAQTDPAHRSAAAGWKERKASESEMRLGAYAFRESCVECLAGGQQEGGSTCFHPYKWGLVSAVLSRSVPMFAPFFWRTAKKDLKENPATQFGVTFKDMLVRFSPVERYFYNKQLANVKAAAHRALSSVRAQEESNGGRLPPDRSAPLASLGVRGGGRRQGGGGRGRGRRWQRAPVRGKGKKQSAKATLGAISQYMSMDDVLSKLQRDAKGEAEEGLRAYVSETNGLAGLALLEGASGLSVAAALYRHVLALAGRGEDPLEADGLSSGSFEAASSEWGLRLTRRALELAAGEEFLESGTVSGAAAAAAAAGSEGAAAAASKAGGTAPGGYHVDRMQRVHALHNLAETLEFQAAEISEGGGEEEEKRRTDLINESLQIRSEGTDLEDQFHAGEWQDMMVWRNEAESATQKKDMEKKERLDLTGGVDWWHALAQEPKSGSVVIRLRESQELELESLAGAGLPAFTTGGGLAAWIQIRVDEAEKRRSVLRKKLEEIEEKVLRVDVELEEGERRGPTKAETAKAANCRKCREFKTGPPCAWCLLTPEFEALANQIFAEVKQTVKRKVRGLDVLLIGEDNDDDGEGRLEENIETYGESLLWRTLKAVSKEVSRTFGSKSGLNLSVAAHLREMEALKTEFLKLRGLSGQQRQIVSSYDELEMCKLRFSKVDRPLVSPETAFDNLLIAESQVAGKRMTLASRRSNAVLEFQRAAAHVRYLKNLQLDRDRERRMKQLKAAEDRRRENERERKKVDEEDVDMTADQQAASSSSSSSSSQQRVNTKEAEKGGAPAAAAAAAAASFSASSSDLQSPSSRGQKRQRDQEGAQAKDSVPGPGRSPDPAASRCPVCLEDYHEDEEGGPGGEGRALLPCAHLICGSCLKTITERHTVKRGVFLCPMCRKQTKANDVVVLSEQPQLTEARGRERESARKRRRSSMAKTEGGEEEDEDLMEGEEGGEASGEDANEEAGDEDGETAGGMEEETEEFKDKIPVSGSWGAKIEAVVRRVLMILSAEVPLYKAAEGEAEGGVGGRGGNLGSSSSSSSSSSAAAAACSSDDREEKGDGSPPEKIVLFSSWNEVLDLLCLALQGNSVEFVRYSGVGVKKGDAGLERFITDPSCRVWVAPLQRAGQGLTLTCANHLMLIEPQMSSAVEAQAFARICRMGQKRHCFIWRFFVASSVEMRIRLLAEKEKEKGRPKERNKKEPGGAAAAAASSSSSPSSLLSPSREDRGGHRERGEGGEDLIVAAARELTAAPDATGVQQGARQKWLTFSDLQFLFGSGGGRGVGESGDGPRLVGGGGRLGRRRRRGGNRRGG